MPSIDELDAEGQLLAFREVDVEVVGWGETEDPYALIAARLTGARRRRRW